MRTVMFGLFWRRKGPSCVSDVWVTSGRNWCSWQSVCHCLIGCCASATISRYVSSCMTFLTCGYQKKIFCHCLLSPNLSPTSVLASSDVLSPAVSPIMAQFSRSQRPADVAALTVMIWLDVTRLKVGSLSFTIKQYCCCLGFTTFLFFLFSWFLPV